MPARADRIQIEALVESLTLLVEQVRASQQALPVSQVQARLALSMLERMAQEAANEARDLLPPLDAAPALPLSPREREVLCLAADGLTYKEIACRLAVSERTVQYHLNSIYNKTGTHSRAEATAVAFRVGWL